MRVVDPAAVREDIGDDGIVRERPRYGREG
jgi:hypothetical protein